MTRLSYVWSGLAVLAVAACGQSGSAAGTGSVPDGETSPLYVAPGDRVRGYGLVVSDGRETRLCGGPLGNPESGAITYPSKPCPEGVELRGFTTSDLVQVGPVRAGNAKISGVWRDGVVHVDSQSQEGQAEPPEQIAFDTSKVPCPAPSSGWSDAKSFPQADYPAALLKLRDKHPEDALGGAVLQPSGEQRALGFVAADADAAKRITDALTPTYGSSICIKVSPYSVTDYQSAARGARYVYQVGEREFSDPLTMVVRWFAVIVDDEVRAALDQLPAGLVRLSSTLKPIAGDAE